MDEYHIIKTIKIVCKDTMLTQKKEWTTLPWRDADKGRLPGEMCEPDHARWIGMVQSFHSGIPARRMSVGKSKKMWNDMDVQGVANNSTVPDSENNGSRSVAGEGLHKLVTYLTRVKADAAGYQGRRAKSWPKEFISTSLLTTVKPRYLPSEVLGFRS